MLTVSDYGENHTNSSSSSELAKNKENDQMFFDLLFFNETFYIVGTSKGVEEMKLHIEANGGTMSHTILSATRVIFLKPKDLTECLKGLKELNNLLDSHRLYGQGIPLSEGWINDQIFRKEPIQTKPYLIDDKNLFDNKFWNSYGKGVEKGSCMVSTAKDRKSKKPKTVHFPSSPSSSSNENRSVASSSGSFSIDDTPTLAQDNKFEHQVEAKSYTPLVGQIAVRTTQPVSSASLPTPPASEISFSSPASSPSTSEQAASRETLQTQRLRSISKPSWNTQNSVTPAKQAIVLKPPSARQTRSGTLKRTAEEANFPGNNIPQSVKFSNTDGIVPEKNRTHAVTHKSLSTGAIKASNASSNLNTSIAPSTSNISDDAAVVATSLCHTSSQGDNNTPADYHPAEKDDTNAKNSNIEIPKEISNASSKSSETPSGKSPSVNKVHEEPLAIPHLAQRDGKSVEGGLEEDTKPDQIQVKSESKSAIYNRRYRNQTTVQSQDQVAYRALVSDLKAKVAGGGFPRGGMKAYLISRGIHSLYTKYGTLVREEVPGLPHSRENFAKKSQGINSKWQQFIDEQNAEDGK